MDKVHAAADAGVTNDRLSTTFEVADFGPLLEARVDLRPLTVFVGPSNTGKSWLATLVYAWHRHFGPGTRPDRTMPPPLRLEMPPPGAGQDALVSLAEELAVSEAAPDVELPSSVVGAICLRIEYQSQLIVEEISRCLGVDSSRHLVRANGPSRGQVQLSQAVEGVPKPAVHELSLVENGDTLKSTIPKGLRVRSNPELRYLATRWLRQLRPQSVSGLRLKWLTGELIDALAPAVLPERRPAYYLPAGRTGLMDAHSVVVSTLIQSAARAGIRPRGPLPALSGVQADFLDQLLQMADGPGGHRTAPSSAECRKLADRLQKEILGGQIRIEKTSGTSYPRFSYLPRGWKSRLPLASTSSMVSELAPVVLYLRRLDAGDLLVIDEPEAHLHPRMQVEFANLLADVVLAGVRVIMTTHSEWVLEALGNIVSRAELAGQTLGGGELDSRQVGVWLFEPHDGGSKVREVQLDSATGLYSSGFDAVATALHNTWAGLAGQAGDIE